MDHKRCQKLSDQFRKSTQKFSFAKIRFVHKLGSINTTNPHVAPDKKTSISPIFPSKPSRGRPVLTNGLSPHDIRLFSVLASPQARTSSFLTCNRWLPTSQNFLPSHRRQFLRNVAWTDQYPHPKTPAKIRSIRHGTYALTPKGRPFNDENNTAGRKNPTAGERHHRCH